MILPGSEPRVGTIPAKIGYEISLEYQLGKVMWCAENFFEKFIADRDINDLEDETYFHLDALINGAVTLIEYYYSNVIYSLMGTILEAPKKIEFRAFSKSNYASKKAEIFKKYKIGELTRGDDSDTEKYRKQCEEQFDSYLDFILKGKYELLFELNNHIKHNGRLNGFWLKRLLPGNYFIKYHSINFDNDFSFLLKNKTIKKLLSIDYNDFSTVDLELLFEGGPYEMLGHHGYNIYFNNDDWVYVKGINRVGITSLSIIIKICQLSLEIINHVITSKTGELTTLRKMTELKATFEKKLTRLLQARNSI